MVPHIDVPNPPLIPNLFGFKKLILSSEPSDGGTAAEVDRGSSTKAYSSGKKFAAKARNGAHSTVGIPFGATMLLSGPPGAGKTTFALSLARALMKEAIEDQKNSTSKLNRAKTKPFILYYLSSEIGIDRLKKDFQAMDWFPNEHDKTQKDRLFQIDSRTPDADTFYTIAPEPQVDRPVPSPEELVNAVFNRMGKSVAPTEAATTDRHVIVLVDSITALLKGCATESEERRQTHEILHRLRSMFGNQLALTVLLAEHVSIEPSDPQASSAEDYIAEIVFRLYQKHLPLGQRVRVLDIVKSQGVHLLRGEHTWEIVTHQNCPRLFPHFALQEEIREYGQEEGYNGGWGTVAIFPRPRLYYDTIWDRKALTGEQKLRSGTRGLDEMLVETPKYWLSQSPPKSNGGLQAGTTTLITGPLGAGKSKLCLQFLFNDAVEAFASAKDKTTIPKPTKESKNVLVSFELNAHEAVGSAWDNWIVDEFKEKFANEKLLRDAQKDWVAILSFRQSQFDFNRLVSDVETILAKLKPQRVAFDGLSEWLTVFERPEAARMLESLMVILGDRKIRPTVFMTYEFPLGEDPLAPYALGVNADNIIVARQINIQDHIRKIIYVLKSTHSTNDKTVRELVFWNKRWEVRPGLDSFGGLLRGEPCRAEVILQLFQENQAEEQFNRWAHRRLRKLHNLEFRVLNFSRTEISRTLEDSDSQAKFPPADLRLICVDEWWLSDTSPERTDPVHPLLPLKDLWGSTSAKSLASKWDDFWMFEVEKTGPEGREGELYAVPAYIDYGMFCVNAFLLGEEAKNPMFAEILDGLGQPNLSQNVSKLHSQVNGGGDCPEDANQGEFLKHVWNNLLIAIPRVWVGIKDGWFDAEAEGTLVALAKKLQSRTGSLLHAFSFDMATVETCACVFFELAWAFGASEEFLKEDKGVPVSQECPAVKALEFLQFLVLEGLLPERTTIEDTTRTLFSRHFYSTLNAATQAEAREILAKSSAKTSPRFDNLTPMLIGLPFFPVGTMINIEEQLIADIVIRLKRLAGRIGQKKHPLRELGSRLAENLKALENNPTQRIKSLQKITEDIRNTLVFHRGQMRVTSLTDLPDVLEMVRWHILRMKLLVGKEDKITLGKIIEDFTGNPLDFNCKELDGVYGDHFRPKYFFPTGYGCTGSWMYGVHKATRSPSLARDLLQELTSLEVAEKRAKLGAGLPARKDFLSLHGSENVPGMEYLSWEDFFRFCGCRARHRERVLPEKTHAALVYKCIQEQVLSCLTRASLLRPRYANTGSPRDRFNIIATIKASASDGYSTILQSLNQ